MGCGCFFVFLLTFIGLRLAGFPGAAIGFFIAFFITYRLGEKTKKRSQNSDSFLILFFSILGRMAKADGTVSKVEADTVKAIINSLGLSGKSRTIAIDSFNQAIKDKIDIYKMARSFTAEYRDYNVRIILYRALWDVALSDSVLSNEELRILQNILPCLNLPTILFESYSQEAGFFSNNNEHNERRSSGERYGNNRRGTQSSHSLKADFDILGVPQDADADTIQQAYRKKVREFHPDKIQAKGLPESFVKFAEEEMKKINDSYNRIKKPHN